jgi:retron-type reverse transcriptase
MRQFIHTYDNIITIEKLLKAWQEFLHDKKDRKDVILFQAKLMDNILDLFNDLKNKTYKHEEYVAFNISDPKPRQIHKAIVRDRLLHHLVYQELYEYFDSKFINDSYSCRVNKGTHKAINQFRKYFRIISRNNTRTCWVLKCDIRKFFANIDHNLLQYIVANSICDKDIIWLIKEIIDSFETKNSIHAMTEIKKGLPLGNLTSQLLVNVYMNEFDQFMKRELKVKYYIRYADDFVILSENKNHLENLLPKIGDFLEKELKLQLHPNKVFIKTLASGVDFLGWVHFPYHRVLRTSTKRKMFKNLKNNPKTETIQSYLGLLLHGDTHKLKKVIDFD